MSARRTPRDAPGSLLTRADALEQALEAGQGRWGQAPVQAAEAVVAKVRQRAAFGDGRVVVALAGSTGSGKSTLFNAIVGEEIATVGVRRPTTDTPTAAIWGQDDAGALLDWMKVGRRHRVVGASGDTGTLREDLDGLVLIDLPDVDSWHGDNRAEADRVLERADVFVWVTDPQKYADARLHEEYLAPLAHHAPVMRVVLNQVDRLPPEQTEQVVADLRRLIEQDLSQGGRDFPTPALLTTSARRGDGVDALVDSLASVVSAHQAGHQRLQADLDDVVERLRPALGKTPGALPEQDDALIDALEQAAAVPIIVDAVGRDHHRQSVRRTGWPVTRWLGRFRPDPLRRFRLGDDRAGVAGIRPSDVRTALGRSSLPKATPAARAAVELATRRLGDRVTPGLPAPWAEAVTNAADPSTHDLTDALDQAVLATPLRTRPPLWWPVFAALQVLLLLAAVTGAVWLTVLAVLGWLQIDAEAPSWLGLPVPAALLIGGAVAGFLLGLLGRILGRAGARRRRAIVRTRLRAAVSRVARERVQAPIGEVLTQHTRARTLLERAAGRG